MKKTCGACHPEQVKKSATALHFTMRNSINLVRTTFGARAELDSIKEIPTPESVKTSLDLADDLLRRRCLRCHVYDRGDAYPETRHGTGCAACHLNYEDGELQSHAFIKLPSDNQCLHCHYGNRVGADYYGRFERDLNREYRTPFRTDDQHPRPYGIEFHQLTPDVHQRAGMSCIDCHDGTELMGTAAKSTMTCTTCHSLNPQTHLPAGIFAKDDQVWLTTKLSNKTLRIPMPTHPAHRRYKQKIDCAVCHAQWSFQDQGTHLLRLDVDDYDAWEPLLYQGSSQVEWLLGTSLYNSDDDLPPTMPDSLSDAERQGIWLKGFEQRRWETPVIKPDSTGRLRIWRPILDLTLSHVDQEGEVIFDAVTVSSNAAKLQPYTPHTIGKAGQFFHLRLPADIHKPQAPATTYR